MEMESNQNLLSQKSLVYINIMTLAKVLETDLGWSPNSIDWT